MDIDITWSDPVANGSPITSYRIFIRESDGVTFTEEVEPRQCDGTSSLVINARSCAMNQLLLKFSPHSLAIGNSIYVKVISVNIYGESIQSEEGNGAVI